MVFDCFGVGIAGSVVARGAGEEIAAVHPVDVGESAGGIVQRGSGVACLLDTHLGNGGGPGRGVDEVGDAGDERQGGGETGDNRRRRRGSRSARAPADAGQSMSVLMFVPSKCDLGTPGEPAVLRHRR